MNKGERYWKYGDMTDEEIAQHKREVDRIFNEIKEAIYNERSNIRIKR